MVKHYRSLTIDGTIKFTWGTGVGQSVIQSQTAVAYGYLPKTVKGNGYPKVEDVLQHIADFDAQKQYFWDSEVDVEGDLT